MHSDSDFNNNNNTAKTTGCRLGNTHRQGLKSSMGTLQKMNDAQLVVQQTQDC